MEQNESKYIEWLNKEGYELETTLPYENDTISWTRKAKYGAPKCTTNGDLMVVVTLNGDSFGMSLRASTTNYWGNVEVYNISEEYLITRGRQIEHRLVDAWRELSA